MPDLEQALDELYSVDLEAFTATRNALAKQLTGADAATVKALKKPSIVAWAINQLVHLHRSEVDELFEATSRLRMAQRRVLSGGKPSELRKATDERNAVVSKLTKLAGKILSDAGKGTSSSTMQAISDSFVAIAADEEAAETLRKGRLTRELEASSFVDVGGLTLVEDAADEAPSPDEKDRSQVVRAREALSEARAAAKEARTALKEANAEALRLAQDADEADRVARAAHESAEFARRAADARRTELEEAEVRVERLQQELEASE